MQGKAKECFDKGIQLLYQTDQYKDYLQEAQEVFGEASNADPTNTTILINKCLCDYFCSRDLSSGKSKLVSDLKSLDNLIENNVGFTKAYYIKALLLHENSYEKDYYNSIKSLEMIDDEGLFIKALCLHQLEYDNEPKNYEFILKMNYSKNLMLYKIIMARLTSDHFEQKLAACDLIIQTYPKFDLGYKEKYFLLKGKLEKDNKEFDKNDKTLLELVDKWIISDPQEKSKDQGNPFKEKCHLMKDYEIYEPALEVADKWITFNPTDIHDYISYKKELLEVKLKDNKGLLNFILNYLFEIDLGKVDFFSRSNVADEIQYVLSDFIDMIFDKWFENENKMTSKGFVELFGFSEADFVIFTNKLIKEGYTNKAYGIMMKGWLAYSKKQYDEAKKCFQDKDLIEYQRTFGYMPLYGLTEVLVMQEKIKEAWAVSEEMNKCLSYATFENHKYKLSSIVDNNYKILRANILNSGLLKEIMTPQKRILQKEAQSKFDEALGYTFSGKQQDFKKAIGLLAETLQIEPDSGLVLFFKVLFEWMDSNDNKGLEEKLNNVIKKDATFLPAYYIKLYNIPEDTWTHNYSLNTYKETIEPLLVPIDQESYLIYALTEIQFRKKYGKAMIEYLGKCTDPRYAKKVLELKIAYYEGNHATDDVKKLTEEFLKLYPSSFAGFASQLKLFMQEKKHAEAIEFALSFKEQLKEEFSAETKTVLDDFIDSLGFASLKKMGLFKFCQKKLMSFVILS